MNLKDLSKVFDPADLEWRVQTGGKRQDGSIWALVLTYVTNRAIMDRLDDVVGPENWRNEFRDGPDGGVLCGLSIKTGDEWVTKWDGAENTDEAPVKGGLSGAMKRAGVQWGIGRYLYNLPATYVNADPNGTEQGRLPKNKGGDYFKWNVPQLPAWALPERPGEKAGNKIKSDLIALLKKHKDKISDNDRYSVWAKIKHADLQTDSEREKQLKEIYKEWELALETQEPQTEKPEPPAEPDLDIF